LASGKQPETETEKRPKPSLKMQREKYLYLLLVGIKIYFHTSDMTKSASIYPIKFINMSNELLKQTEYFSLVLNNNNIIFKFFNETKA